MDCECGSLGRLLFYNQHVLFFVAIVFVHLYRGPEFRLIVMYFESRGYYRH